MAGYYGADTEQLRAHGTASATAATQLNDLLVRTSTIVATTTWTGPDADTFRDEWHRTILPMARSAAQLVRDSAAELESQAEEQDQTSGGSAPTDWGRPIDWGEATQGTVPDILDEPGPPRTQEFYGGPGYGGVGVAYGEERPVGTQFEHRDRAWEGSGIGYGPMTFDPRAGYEVNAGWNTTVDSYGNATGTIGYRASAEVGSSGQVDLPWGLSIDSSHRIGIEKYHEYGGTIGPDGFGAGVRKGTMAYGEGSYGISDGSGNRLEGTGTVFAGEEAHANLYSHATRNEEGNISGWKMGGDANAFVGAGVTQEFSGITNNGWFSSSTTFGEEVGGGAGAGAGAEFSTDQVSLNVGGQIAVELGLTGSTTISVHPNEIVNDFTEGDYDVDDYINDLTGEYDGATKSVEDAIQRINPFN